MRNIDDLTTNILFAKIAWSDKYDGTEVPQAKSQGWVNTHRDGWERFNFKPLPTGECLGYLIPSGGRNLPAVDPRSGWTVIFVAPLWGNGALTPVGFYLDATIEEEYFPRPEYDFDPAFPVDAQGNRYGYCLTTENSDAYLIASSRRESAYPAVHGKFFGTAPFRYAERDGDVNSKAYFELGREIVERGLKLEWLLD